MTRKNGYINWSVRDLTCEMSRETRAYSKSDMKCNIASKDCLGFQIQYSPSDESGEISMYRPKFFYSPHRTL